MWWLYIIGVIGLMIIIASLPKLVTTFRSRHWPITKGIIHTSKIEKIVGGGLDGGGAVHYVANVVYDYDVDGQHFKSSQISHAGPSGAGLSAISIIDQYPKGKEVTVHYDPRNPNKAVLEFRFPFIYIVTLVVGLGMFGLSVFLLTTG